MARFIAARLLHAIPLLLGVVIIIFAVMQAVPGDPVQAIIGQFPVPPAYRAAIEAKFHLTDPLWRRLLSYLAALLHGDLGYSFRAQRPVLDLILERAPRTLLLAITGYTLGIAAGIAVGLHSAVTPRRWIDRAWTTLVLVVYAMPSFWMGQLLVIAFAMQLEWLPTQGMAPLIDRATGLDWLAQRALYLTLPMTTYALYEAARVARLIRASARETLGQGWITTARQKGLSRPAIIRRHVLRNSILPVVTAMGYSFGTAMGGAVLIESVFSWPGVGTLMVESIRLRDNQTVIGVVLFVAICIVLVNLLVDILYARIDPRIALR